MNDSIPDFLKAQSQPALEIIPQKWRDKCFYKSVYEVLQNDHGSAQNMPEHPADDEVTCSQEWFLNFSMSVLVRVARFGPNAQTWESDYIYLEKS